MVVWLMFSSWPWIGMPDVSSLVCAMVPSASYRKPSKEVCCPRKQNIRDVHKETAKGKKTVGTSDWSLALFLFMHHSCMKGKALMSQGQPSSCFDSPYNCFCIWFSWTRLNQPRSTLKWGLYQDGYREIGCIKSGKHVGGMFTFTCLT